MGKMENYFGALWTDTNLCPPVAANQSFARCGGLPWISRGKALCTKAPAKDVNVHVYVDVFL
jgi:hypothetical protein